MKVCLFLVNVLVSKVHAYFALKINCICKNNSGNMNLKKKTWILDFTKIIRHFINGKKPAKKVITLNYEWNHKFTAKHYVLLA